MKDALVIQERINATLQCRMAQKIVLNVIFPW